MPNLLTKNQQLKTKNDHTQYNILKLYLIFNKLDKTHDTHTFFLNY